MSKTVIKLENVSMKFNLCDERIESLKEYFIRLTKGSLNFKEFWALKDINFEVKKGEKIGIIGLNGSGKSTLLKIISGVLRPTYGTVSILGSIAPLIELGAGFDMELSAKENVYLNGAVLGYSDKTIDREYNNIMNFSELTKFENVAIKNFSSGMLARLGFSIATFNIPDILIIDEILSVGDYAFQEKCKQRMHKLTDKGTTVLFVSHDHEQVLELCDKVIWLENGKILEIGSSKNIIPTYLGKQITYE